MKKALFAVSGLFFAMISFIQLARLYVAFPVIIGNQPLPMWASGVGFLITAAISVWMFVSAAKAP